MKCLFVWTDEESDGFHICTPEEIDDFFEHVDDPESIWYHMDWRWDEL